MGGIPHGYRHEPAPAENFERDQGPTHIGGVPQGYRHDPTPTENFNRDRGPTHIGGIPQDHTRGPVPTENFSSGGSGPHYEDEARRTVSPESNTGMRGSAEDGSHSAVFGLTPDGHKHHDTSPKRSDQDLPGQNTTNYPPGYHPPKGTAVRSNEPVRGNEPMRGEPIRSESELAPTPVTGEVERLQSPREPSPPRDKPSTISKLFKRKPVASDNPNTVDAPKVSHFVFTE